LEKSLVDNGETLLSSNYRKLHFERFPAVFKLKLMPLQKVERQIVAAVKVLRLEGFFMCRIKMFVLATDAHGGIAINPLFLRRLPSQHEKCRLSLSNPLYP
jgi:hypothetical protein